MKSRSRYGAARYPAFWLALILLSLAVVTASPARANDHMFPAAPEAKPFCDYDSKGFLINGKRTFLVSAGMEYARVPQALWRDRLLRLKRAGFNCVEVYNFWNWHEPTEGKFDFRGDHDLGAYLRLVKQLGLYAICRVGPYYCAEWDNGGYPLWLRFKPGLRVREDNKPFLTAVDHFFDKLIPIVAANQINHGGSVVLVQLENEGAGWGTDEPNAYFTHLRTKAVELGLQVPYFFSGLHHSSDPASDTAMDDPNRPNPWFSTEYWSVWYDHYGPRPEDAPTYARRTWKIIAHGGNGYNYYMAHGGTNFAYTNNNEDAASYDYGAAVGQAGDLRPLYGAFKRAAWFARSFEEILENASDATADQRDGATNQTVRVTARRGPAGTVMFLDNPSRTSQQTFVHIDGVNRPVSGPMTLAAGEILPVVRNFALAPGVTLEWAVAHILGVVPQGDTTTLVIYGAPGAPVELSFKAPAGAQIVSTAGGFRTVNAVTLNLSMKIPSGEPVEQIFKVGTRRVRILAVSDAQVDRSWFVDVEGQTSIVCGPGYVGEAGPGVGGPRLTIERPWQETTDLPTLVYGPTGPPMRFGTPVAANLHLTSLALSPWQAADASRFAAPGYDDHAWQASDVPLQMGADGDLTAGAWYRARLNVPTSGEYTLQANGGDRAFVFVDGARTASGRLHSNFSITLAQGNHILAVFMAHDGRDKLFGHVGSMELSDPKGLMGPVTLRRGNAGLLTGWRVRKAANAEEMNAGPPAADADGWQAYTVGQDAFNRRRGFAWFQTTLPASIGAAHASLHFESVDDNGTVFVNGKQVARHQGWDTAFDVPVTPGPEATLSVFVENTDNTGGLGKPVRFVTQIGDDATTTGWKMRGGIGNPPAPSDWKPLITAETFTRPTFFRTTFTAAPPPGVGAHPIWRVVSTSLGHGSVWVNGHNLGRYPEKVPINGLYIPECWLVTGKNTVVIYDEDGLRPDQVTVASETAASRDVAILVAPK